LVLLLDFLQQCRIGVAGGELSAASLQEAAQMAFADAAATDHQKELCHKTYLAENVAIRKAIVP
jgi:hypothetical protein